MTKGKGNVFAFSFSSEGFEAIVNLSEIDQAGIIAKMGEESPSETVNGVLNMLSIRARFNQNRQMEIWLLKFDDGITEESLWEQCQSDPQSMATLAREHGEAVFSEYVKNKATNVIS